MKRSLICPVCGSRANDFLQRPNVPIHQHLLWNSQDAARGTGRGDLTLACCGQCGFIFNSTFEPAKLVYGENYENSQLCSPFFNHYIDGLIGHLIEEQKVQNCRVIEVGCGQGSFLKRLVERGTGISGYGFDPSYRGPATTPDGRITFLAAYYGPGFAGIAADFVICRHVIEHVADPVALLTSIHQALSHSPRARLFLETPAVDWILHNAAYWDFFYEHCSYFTAASLARAVETAGFAVRNVCRKFNGQYLWLEAVIAPDETAIVQPAEPLVDLVKQFALRERSFIAKWRDILERKLIRGEKTAVWGAGAKGVTFVNLMDPEGKYLECVVDINPKKQGNFLPGTGHPIVGIPALAERRISSVILMNPNYKEEVMAMLNDLPANIVLVEMENDYETDN
ncbi:c-methyltransferase [Lucifera butyrica]|uniref:C-methyltransferase n=1 Tax=Lucifera butyrica TaxID=1351585 RepID=A0A498R1F9_9FIRM|nr:class I SAM-dependent methyltransferase [Lucifera butyrica]VBB05181.1 c-methyltransferase [Lucifera butyrica]